MLRISRADYLNGDDTLIQLRIHSIGLVIYLQLLSVSTAFASNDAHSLLRIGQARLVDPAGGSLGAVQLIELKGRLNVIGKVKGLTAGFHGFHIHENGECIGSSTPPFTSAGGHLRAAGDNHPGHSGDMPVLLVGTDGTAQASFTTDRVTLADILDSNGAAIIIHAAPDNYANIPPGTPLRARTPPLWRPVTRVGGSPVA